MSILRLDRVHPVISGNKLFKLHYFFNKQHVEHFEQVVTFGGAYSNHLVATAFYCKEKKLACSGIVRGERPLKLSPTLQACEAYGMKLYFISRQAYNEKDREDLVHEIIPSSNNCLIIPEGGYHPAGAKGAKMIMEYIEDSYTHICTAAGTATTLAGLAMGAKNHQQIIGIPVLKGMYDIEKRVNFLTDSVGLMKKIQIFDDYHFGGYAKGNAQLFSFMNELYSLYQLPTDFVYTGKMLFAIFDLIKSDFFSKGSKIVCIHTGGIQGNQSLTKGTLTFK